MRFTKDGTVFGECPKGFQRRLPQIQLFVKIREYNGVDKTYQLSDGSSNFHIDFFNGWQEEKLQEVINDCEVIDPNQPDGEINPQTGCTPQTDNPDFLTASNFAEGSVCDRDVRNLIINEATYAANSLPSGSCNGQLIPKSWNQLRQNLFSGKCDFDRPCVEKKKKRFFLKKNKGKTVKKRCGWLQKRNGKKSWKIACGKKNGNGAYDPANIVCPVTCGTCGFSKWNQSRWYIFS